MTSAVVSPVRVNARLDNPLSRWLWLVKWLLVVPHLIVLGFLWVGFTVLTVIAFFAILGTGRYPRAIFEFDLGVLRWSWRVAYYAYGGLGTDHYPPFTLGPVPDYPATLDIAYPEHLSRGLVLVKWLLGLPHYVIVAFFVGGGSYAAYRAGTWSAGSTTTDSWSSGGGLIGFLVLVAGIALLFTGRYPRGLFDLLLGLHRWVLRVVAYAALMTDDYPPFRLDTGGSEHASPTFADAASRTGVSAPQGSPPPVGPPPADPWSAGRIVTAVVGSILLLGAVGAAVGGTAVLSGDRAGRDADGFLTTPVTSLAGSGYALVFDPVELRDSGSGVGALVGDVRVHATGAAPGGVFVGVGPTDAVEGYLGSVERERLVRLGTDGRGEQLRIPGGAPVTPPAAQTFWAASAAGPGPQQLTWTATEGRWSAAVMNADGTRPVVADLALGATVPGLRWVWTGFYIAAGLALVIGSGLVLLAVRRPRPIAATV